MVSKAKTIHTYHITIYCISCNFVVDLLLASIRYLPPGPPYNRMNGDVFGRIIDYGGEEGSFLFVNMVCKSWVKVHGEKKKYTTTFAIMTSHPRLAWVVDAG